MRTISANNVHVNNNLTRKSEMEFTITGLTFDQLTTATNALNSTPATPSITDELNVIGGFNTPHPPAVASDTMIDALASDTMTTGIELDATGLPWDGRIHASTKTKTAAGNWKKAKGVDKATIPVIEAELRAAGATSTVPAHEFQPPAAPAPPAPAAPITLAASTPITPVPMPVTPDVHSAPTAGATPAAPSVSALIGVSLANPCREDIPHDVMMNQINIALGDPDNPVQATDIPAICNAFNIQTLPECVNDPVAIGKIYYILGGQ